MVTVFIDEINVVLPVNTLSAWKNLNLPPMESKPRRKTIPRKTLSSETTRRKIPGTSYIQEIKILILPDEKT